MSPSIYPPVGLADACHGFSPPHGETLSQPPTDPKGREGRKGGKEDKHVSPAGCQPRYLLVPKKPVPGEAPWVCTRSWGPFGGGTQGGPSTPSPWVKLRCPARQRRAAGAAPGASLLLLLWGEPGGGQGKNTPWLPPAALSAPPLFIYNVFFFNYYYFSAGGKQLSPSSSESLGGLQMLGSPAQAPPQAPHPWGAGMWS